MALSRVHTFMLYTIGFCHEQFVAQFSGKPITLMLSKKEFIALVSRAGIAHKGERALYQNLQDLEEKKYISYEGKIISLSVKGEKIFAKIKKDIAPYVEISNILVGDILKYTEKRQTTLTR